MLGVHCYVIDLEWVTLCMTTEKVHCVYLSLIPSEFKGSQIVNEGVSIGGGNKYIYLSIYLSITYHMIYTTRPGPYTILFILNSM